MCKDHLLAGAFASHEPDSLVLTTPQMPERIRDRQTRYKLWELQDCWHCMVIGTCLTLAEVRQAATKAKISVVDKTDYAIHQLAVECAANKQQMLSQRLQKVLEKKYSLVVKQYRAAKTADELKKRWSVGWESGEIAGNLWALITHPMVSREIIIEVFGQVHMLSHLSGSSACAGRRLQLKQESEISTLTNELKSMKVRYGTASAKILKQRSQLETEQANVRKYKALADQAMEQAQKLPQSIAGKSDAADYSHLIDPLRRKNHELRQTVVEQKTLHRRQTQEVERLQRLLSAYENKPKETDNEALKLCGQCVLYLGGKTQQRRHFQAYVESCEGRFLHHDGGREVCPHRISELVSQADVVMCPTDCISHGAMEKARSLCAKQEKPIVFMQRASLSSFTRSLQEVIAEAPTA